MTVHQRVDGPTTWIQNGYSWTETFPQEPYLVSLYKGDSVEYPSMERASQNGGLDPISRAFPAQIGEVLESASLLPTPFSPSMPMLILSQS